MPLYKQLPGVTSARDAGAQLMGVTVPMAGGVPTSQMAEDLGHASDWIRETSRHTTPDNLDNITDILFDRIPPAIRQSASDVPRMMSDYLRKPKMAVTWQDIQQRQNPALREELMKRVIPMKAGLVR